MKTSKINKSSQADQCSRDGGLKIASSLCLLVSMFLLVGQQAQPTDAILNCFTPNMFKMGKAGQPGASYGGESPNWYPQAGYQGGYPGGYAGQHNPMKSLFQPKWKTGSSLFGGGNKFGWNSWRMANSFRPGYGGYGGVLSGPTVGYPFSEQLQLPAQPNLGNSYSGLVSQLNDGWSAPVTYPNQQLVAPIQQAPIGSYEGAYSTDINKQQQQQASGALLQPGKQQPANPYGTKGGSGNKNTLMADGTGYGIYKPQTSNQKNASFGYTYPEWYSGVIESPSKIAQQLMKFGLKGQQKNRSLPLVLQSTDLRQPSSSFTILDQPRFVGFGTVEELNNREARLSCSFNEAIDQTNRPLWIKFQGPYNSSQTVNNKVVPPFNCANSQCRTLEIESTKDFRYRFDNGPATSTLVIAEPRLSDYGIYRCSALTKAINDNPLETVYQVIRFGSLK